MVADIALFDFLCNVIVPRTQERFILQFCARKSVLQKYECSYVISGRFLKSVG